MARNIHASRLLQWALISLCALFIVGYGYNRTRSAVEGPKLSLFAPVAGATTSPVVIVAGTGVRTTEISLNGAMINLTPEGHFTETVSLALGYNKITVVARDRFGASVTESRILILRSAE